MSTHPVSNRVAFIFILALLDPQVLYAEDCNGNGGLDTQDITLARSEDCNHNGIPDECDLSAVRLSTPSYYSVPRDAGLIEAGDLDRDGDVDLVIATSTGGGYVSVLLNAGDGTFSGPAEYVAANSPLCLAIADLNGDHFPEIIAGGMGGLLILTNRMDGTFDSPASYATQRTRSVVARDLDDDGDIDLAMVTWNYGYEVAKVRVWKNAGNGTFPSTVTYSFGNALTNLLAADLDGDHDLDLVTANGNYTCNCAYLLFNNGSGSFDSPVPREVGAIPTGVIGEDLDGDGDFDLVVHENASAHQVLLNNGHGVFSDGLVLTLAWPLVWIETLDLDGDADADLVATGTSDDTITYYLNRGNATFNPPMRVKVSARPLGVNPVCLTAADFDGDHHIDLATANTDSRDVAVLLNHPVEPFNRDRNHNGIPDDCDCWKPCDANGDLDVDGDDLEAFAACVSGAAVTHGAGCAGWDLDCDGDVDQSDFALFQVCFSGSGHPADTACTNG